MEAIGLDPPASGASKREAEGWPTAPLGDVIEEVALRARDVSEGDRLPVLSLTKDRGLIPQADRFGHRVATDDVGDYKVVKRGWLVYNPYVIWEGAIHVRTEPDSGLVSPVYAVWRPTQCDAAYLNYLVRTPQLLAEYSRLSSGVVRRRRSISKEAFIQIEVPVPPIEVQHEIGQVITALDSDIRETARVAEASQQLKAVLRQHFFSRHWETIPLKDLLREPLRNGRSARESPDGNGVRTFTLSAVTQSDFSERNTKVTTADPGSVEQLWAEPGDIFIERANTRDLVGLAALYDGPGDWAIFPDLLIRVRVDTAKLDPCFLTEFLLSRSCRDYFRGSARGTARSMPKIGQVVVERLMVPVPPIARQRGISGALRQLDEKLRAELAVQDALHLARDSVVTRLISGSLQVSTKKQRG